MLAAVPDPALVLLGPPGSGKSTLLRHFELDNARTVLAASAAADPTDDPVTFFIALNGYGTRGADPPPRPHDWLRERWAAENPDLPPLDTLLRERRVTLLLDALNEMPQTGPEPLRCWKAFLAELTSVTPATGRSSPAAAWTTAPRCRPRTCRCRRCASRRCPTRKSSTFCNSTAPITTPRSGTIWPIRPNWRCCARPIFSSC